MIQITLEEFTKGFIPGLENGFEKT